jgi:hypothetical protein
MKQLFILLALAMSLSGYSSAQVDSFHIKDAGLNMMRYYGLQNTGTVLKMVGSGIFVATAIVYSGSSNSNSSPAPFLIAGSLFGLSGYILSEWVAPVKLRNAGIKLTGSGVSVYISNRRNQRISNDPRKRLNVE